MKYTVTFMLYYEYNDIEADDECEAKCKAEQQFKEDMSYPVARSYYDDVEVCIAEGEE